jgi:hypothetical protein
MQDSMQWIVGHAGYKTKIDWEVSHKVDAPTGLTLSFPGVSLRRSEAIRTVAEDLKRTGTDWFELHGNKWHVELDKLRTAFSLQDSIWSWLSGHVVVEPEHHVEPPKPVWGAKGAQAFLFLIFERDTLQHILETPEDARARVAV